MKLRFLWFLIVCPVFGHCQDFSLKQDSIYLSELPDINFDGRFKSNGLPTFIDNSQSIHFPPVIDQYGYSCNQASSIGYLLTYQISCDRGKNARLPENRLSQYFAWNLLNSGENDKGVSFFDSWELVRAIGCPDEISFGFIDATTWMSGYDSYYMGMHNRIKGIYKIDVSTVDGLMALKHWLYNQAGESNYGGCANFQIGSANIRYVSLPESSQDAGGSMISHFSSAVGHSMTIVGYNDSIWYDWNQDGKFTNTLSYNDKGELTMEDWERGALICVNSFGNLWENRGFVYLPYRLLSRDHWHGGIWMKSVVVARTNSSYRPQLCMRLSVDHHDRSKLWITAGVSNNPNAEQPEIILDKPVFKFQGGVYPMRGEGDSENEQIEIGLDITPLLNYVLPGIEASFFLVITEEDSSSQYTGRIDNFSIIDYVSGIHEYTGDVHNEAINHGSSTYRISFAPNYNQPEIITSSLSGAVPGEYYQYQLDADKGEPPYEWMPFEHYFYETELEGAFPAAGGRKILSSGNNIGYTEVYLPFVFPYYGKQYEKVIIHASGAIVFEPGETDYPYAVDESLRIASHVAIYPNYNEDFRILFEEHGVYIEESQDKAIISWNVISTGYSGFEPNRFNVIIYPDGAIEFHYESLESRIYRRNTRFLSGGNRDNAFFPMSFQSGFKKVSGVRFEPLKYPKGMYISSSGLFYGIPNESGNEWLIPFRVKDNLGLENVKLIPFEAKSTGQIETGKQNDLRVFPNPSQGGFSIEAGVDNAKGTVFNASGQLVSTWEISGGKGYLDASNWEKGVYVFTWENNFYKLVLY